MIHELGKGFYDSVMFIRAHHEENSGRGIVSVARNDRVAELFNGLRGVVN